MERMVRVRPQRPSLVGVSSKYPSDLLPGLLRDPNAKMRAGAMPAVDLSATDMSALVSYLGALGTSAANVPAMHTAQPHTAQQPLRAVKPGVSSTTATAAVSIAAGQEIFETHACSACHGVAGAGTARAPALAALVANLPDTELAGLLRNPNGKMRAGGMSPLVATPEQEKSVIAYLRSLSPASPAIAQQQAESCAQRSRNSECPSPCAASIQRRHNGSSGGGAEYGAGGGKYRRAAGPYLWPMAVRRVMGRTPKGHASLRRSSEWVADSPSLNLPTCCVILPRECATEACPR